MRRSILLSLSLLLMFSLAALAVPVGTYVGKWVGGNAEGTFKISLSQAPKGEWQADVSFTYADANIQCKTVSVKVEENKLEVVYDFQIADLHARSTVIGEIKGDEMSGNYHTQAADGSDVDQGTWKVSLTK